MADLFGDTSLFDEFEKDREADASFIRYDENSVKSRIIFEGFDSDEEPESDDDWVAEIIPPKIKINGVEPEGFVKPDDAAGQTKEDKQEPTQNGEKEENEEHEKKDSSEENAEGKIEPQEDKSKDEDGQKQTDKDEEKSDKDAEKPDKDKDVEKSKEDPNDKDKEDGEIEMETDAEKSIKETENEVKNVKENEVKKDTENEVKKETPTVKTPLLPLPTKENSTPKIEEKPEEKISLLDDDDTAWLYEHLYNKKSSTAAKPNLQQLKYERNKYHRFCKILDSTRYVPDEGSPAVQLLFNNNTFARKYRQQIEQFIKGLLWQEFNSNKPDSTTEIDARSSAPSCIDINEKLGPEQRNEAMRQKHVLLGNCQFHKQFLIDFLGWPFTTKEPLRCNINWEIPLYGQVFDEVYADPSCKPKKPVKKTAKPACWNCGTEGCSVSMCRMPRNQTRITNNRREFMEQQEQQGGRQPPKFTGASRYHLDPEIASKYAKYRPGHLSEPLREALGLASHQLPQHVYKMRLYGYPPGWLAKAKQVESGVAIFDKDGRAEAGSVFCVTQVSGDSLEEGEVEEKNEYDVSRIIEFPGFTVPTPEDVVDDHENFKMPPIQEHQLKKTLQQQSEEKVASRKRKREEKIKEEEEAAAQAKKAKTDESANKDIVNLNTNNSAIKEEVEDKNEASDETKEGETKETEEKETDKDTEKDTGNVSEKEADKDKEKDADADSNATEPCDDVKMEEVSEQPNGDADMAEEPEAKDDSIMQPPDTPSTPKTSSAPAATPTSASTRSLSRDYGTPILVRQKSGLPDASKFAAGAEEHIPFENLPDAVGTFDKMRKTIDIIRQKNKK